MKKLLFLIFVLFGCTIKTIPNIDAEINDSEFASDADYSHPCNLETINEDFYNCGECNRRCSPMASDRCFDGACFCGVDLSCPFGQDCRIGRCISPDPEGKICEFDNECFAGNYCIQGRCTFVECVPEVCDGYDNDCDGFIDGSEVSPLIERCYSGGAIGEPLTLPCRYGYRICTSGIWTSCLEEVSPIVEQGLLACDGIDNDCDGCIDGVHENGECTSRSPRIFDIFFVIDVSGSMSGNISAVKIATSTFSSSFADNPAFRFALATFPGVASDLRLVTDFTDFSIFDLELSMISVGSGAIEPSYDIIHSLFTDRYSLGWRDGSSRIIVMFTDEMGQSNKMPPITESIACSARVRGEYLAVITDVGVFADFDECADLFEISSDWSVMSSRLESVISNPCER